MSEIKTAWQSMSDDNGGIGQIPGPIFWSWTDAHEAGDGWGGRHPDPMKRMVYVGADGRMFLESDEVRVYGSRTELDRERALAKLSEEDRRVLGV